MEEIYREAKLSCAIRQVVQYAKAHNVAKEADEGTRIMPGLIEWCNRYADQDQARSWALYQYIQALRTFNDFIQFGDTLENRVLPLLEWYMAQQGSIRTENDEGDYLFESTASGFLTVRNLKDGRYFHSTIDPMWEARRLAKYIHDPSKARYVVWGCGLGYLIYQIYDFSYGSAVIHVYERDARMVEYARKYGVLDWVPQENLQIVVGESLELFLQDALQEDSAVHIFVPEMYGVDGEDADILKEMQIGNSSRLKHKKDCVINYWSNLRQKCKMVSDFDASGFGEDFIVVAGGPSVDESMEFLRDNQGKKTILCVGTVFRKLMQAGITPDMVAVMDPQERTYGQLAGMEDCKVPMLLTIQAYWKFAALYQGEKYLVPTTDLGQLVEYAGLAYKDPWTVGGTVTDLAMEAAVRFGARRVYLVGVDLAFPGGFTHAEGTMDRKQKNLDNLDPVEGVGGKTVYADKVFSIYRKQIERRIAQTPQVEWHNMSRVGARIAGTIEVSE